MDRPAATPTRITRHLLYSTLACLAFAASNCTASPAAASQGTSDSAATQVASPRDALHAAEPRVLAVPALLKLALVAYQQGHLVAPASDNAASYYLAILQQDPRNRVAADAVRELFPYAVAQIGRTLNRQDYAEAEREIDLLAQTDPTNYTLTILRGKLSGRSGAHPVAGGTGAHVLTLRASANSWIVVEDAAGRTLDARMLRPNESRSYRVDGATRVTLGNAGGVEVTGDGRPYPLGGDLHAKVLHLELFARG